MQFHAHIGVLPEEKKVGQTIQVDLQVKVSSKPKDDKLSSTVSYADFYPIIKKIVAESPVNLIETLAQRIIDGIDNEDDRIKKVKVKIRKLNLPVDGVFDNVEIEMNN